MKQHPQAHKWLLSVLIAGLLITTGVFAVQFQAPDWADSVERSVVYKTWVDDNGTMHELTLDIYHPGVPAAGPMKFHVFFPDFYTDPIQVTDDAAVEKVFEILAGHGFTGISVDYRGEDYFEYLSDNGTTAVFNPVADAMDAVTFVRDRYKRVDSARGQHLAVWGAGKLGGHTALMAALAYGEPGPWETVMASRRLFRSGSLRTQVFPAAVAAWSATAAPGLIFDLWDSGIDLPPDLNDLLEVMSPTTYLQERSLPVLLAPNPAYLEAFLDGDHDLLAAVESGPALEALPEADLPPLTGFLPYIFDLHGTRMVETGIYRKANVHHIATPEWLKVRWFLDMYCDSAGCPPELEDVVNDLAAYPGLEDIPAMTAEFLYQNTDPAAVPGDPPPPSGSEPPEILE